MTAAPLMNVGAILSGRWQIQDFIGSGETGEVYGVRDMHSTGTFALKLFWPNALGQSEIWSAVQQTARTASGLGVEGIARAYDFGIDANSGRPFVVTERVSWSSLADRVKVRGPLTPADMAAALEVLGRALDAAHAAGIVHRDLKPDNVFVSPENASWVRISDFGVALLRSASPPPPGWGGTVGWVAPDGADPKARSTPAMDVYALGLVTFFALSGGALHRAARAATIDPGALWQELGTPLDSASVRARELGVSIDPAFDPWFQRAVAQPQARFGSVGEMASAFVAIARTLFAPQSQSAVAIAGIAAAIAQPLVFQPESLPPPAAAPRQATLASAAVGAPVVSAQNSPSSEIPGVRKRSAAPLFIGGAVLCFGLTALGAVALYRNREGSAEAAASASAAAAAAAASASANAALAAASAAAIPTASDTAAAQAAPSAVPNPTQAHALFKCVPQACEAVVCDGKALPGIEAGPVDLAPGEHSCNASRAGLPRRPSSSPPAPARLRPSNSRSPQRRRSPSRRAP
ncbi:MAG TPA: serine/threonine-protein kinase [Polyangiaceae bacterium]|nr:serine/threonine-protein kinase [Polyangiaceae bacterium]